MHFVLLWMHGGREKWPRIDLKAKWKLSIDKNPKSLASSTGSRSQVREQGALGQKKKPSGGLDLWVFR